RSTGIDMHHLLMFFRLHGRILCVKRAGALAATQIGNANPGQHLARQCLRWECAGTAKYNARNTGFAQVLPYGDAPTPVYHTGEGEHAFWPLETCESDVWEISRG